MQKKNEIEIGSYRLEIFPKKTQIAYENLPRYEGEDLAARFFLHLLAKAKKESLAFLSSLGILPEKLFLARPISEPDESGEILYYCAARICAKVLAGGDTEPRQSEEIAGLSVIFVGEEKNFSAGLFSLGEPEAELRFVIPLPFDPAFFENLEEKDA